MPAIVRGATTRKAARPKTSAKTGARPARRGAAVYGASGRFAGIPPKTAALATVGVGCLLSLVLLATGGRGQAIAQHIGRGVDNTFGRAGFAVREIKVEGASPEAEPMVRAAVDVPVGTPILGLNLTALRDRVGRIGFVQTVRVERMLPDVLTINVVERRRIAVWQHRGRLSVIDPAGRVIVDTDARHFTDLPLLVGEGADTTAAAILPLIQARPSLMGRLWALVRVDNRRWDLVLRNQSLIQLPAEGEEAALMRLDQLERDAGVLSLGVPRIDLKTPDVRIRPRELVANPASSVASTTTAG